MCTFKEKIEETEVSGYKVAVKSDGKYYSPATGIEYKPGPVTPATGIDTRYISNTFVNVLHPNNRHYMPHYEGFTAIFKSPNNAKYIYVDHNHCDEIPEHCKLCILSMKLSGDIHNGEYTGFPVYIGKEIVSMEGIDANAIKF